MGHLPKVVGNKKYLIVCTDYFTKWVEAEPLANIRDMGVKRFIWKNIVTRFGVPNGSSQIMVFNLTAKPSGSTVLIWV